MSNKILKPTSFTLQWHITERCNWRCGHCYQNKDFIKKEMSRKELAKVLNQYIFLIKKWGLSKKFARINITGGEPMIRKDFLNFARSLGDNVDLFEWALLTNGSLLTKKNIKKLKDYNIVACQVSLEGEEKTNDKIRGKGSFKKILKAIEMLVDANIKTVVSLTLTKENIKDVPALAKRLGGMGVSTLGVRRPISWGRGKKLKNSILEPKELKNFYRQVLEANKSLIKEKSSLRISTGCESGLFNSEMGELSIKNYCGIIEGRIMVIMPNGDIYPCRRLPIKLGNIKKDTMKDVYFGSEKLADLRNLNNAHIFCKKCSNFDLCFGGAPCVKYCYAGKLFVPDVQCYKYYKKLENPEFFKKHQDLVWEEKYFKN